MPTQSVKPAVGDPLSGNIITRLFFRRKKKDRNVPFCIYAILDEKRRSGIIHNIEDVQHIFRPCTADIN